jgi:haloacetate dehalogenase
MERRMFLGAVTSTSLGFLLNDSLSQPARAGSNKFARANTGGQVGFETSNVQVAGNSVFFRRYGKGPAILLVHGFPRTSLMWRFLAPKLVRSHCDLRRPARLWTKRDTRFYKRPFSVFKTRDGEGTC